VTQDGPPQLDVLTFAALGAVSHGVTTRHGGVSPEPYGSLNMGYSTLDAERNVTENRRRLLSRLGIPAGQVVTGCLTHGNAVAVFRRRDRRSWPREMQPLRPGSGRDGWTFRADAVVSDVPSLHFLLTVADCVPVLFVDRRTGAVGAAHAGWRGTAAGISAEVVRAMRDAFGTRPTDIAALIGPSIGPCCYTIGPDVQETFHRRGLRPVTAERQGATYLDLWSNNRRQLEDMGVRRSSIEIAGLCTSCGVAHFFSHRAERGRTGRMAFAVGAG
jgi:YfiH family protein